MEHSKTQMDTHWSCRLHEYSYGGTLTKAPCDTVSCDKGDHPSLVSNKNKCNRYSHHQPKVPVERVYKTCTTATFTVEGHLHLYCRYVRSYWRTGCPQRVGSETRCKGCKWSSGTVLPAVGNTSGRTTRNLTEHRVLSALSAWTSCTCFPLIHDWWHVPFYCPVIGAKEVMLSSFSILTLQ